MAMYSFLLCVLVDKLQAIPCVDEGEMENKNKNKNMLPDSVKKKKSMMSL